VIVDDVNLVRVTVTPGEADAVLIVDPDAVLPVAITRERFKVVAGKRTQVAKAPRSVQLLELSLSDAGDTLEAAAEPAGEQVLSLPVAKRADHVDRV